MKSIPNLALMRKTLPEIFGNIDIYLFDQLLKGRYDDCKKILDAGCGGGRNAVYFLQNNFEVFGIDPSEQAIENVKRLSSSLAPSNPLTNFTVGVAEDLPYSDATFDLIICNTVLHFAKNEHQFESMLRSMFRVLKPNGYFFARLASDIGMEELMKPLGNRRFLLPDGTEWFLVNEKILLTYTAQLGKLYEPIKTTIVQNTRCMTTWCVRKT